ncbi:hypothetical protein UB32_09865 [Mesobacillus subterraneus]|uniref:Uncharacterized protein n=1 Tax=Mesobacillus subterraneus TaxID=285983 RepID=A0A0D6ZBY6_9BACI|nr:hypothetical protein UB32_09865 [Mesobacillus subterraneus]
MSRKPRYFDRFEGVERKVVKKPLLFLQVWGEITYLDGDWLGCDRNRFERSKGRLTCRPAESECLEWKSMIGQTKKDRAVFARFFSNLFKIFRF